MRQVVAPRRWALSNGDTTREARGRWAVPRALGPMEGAHAPKAASYSNRKVAATAATRADLRLEDALSSAALIVPASGSLSMLLLLLLLPTLQPTRRHSLR